MSDAVFRIGEYVADHGMTGAGRVPGRPGRAAAATAAARRRTSPSTRRERGRLGGPYRAGARGRRAADPGSARRGQDLHRRADDLRAGAGRQKCRDHREQPQGHPQPARRRGRGSRRAEHRRSVHSEGAETTGRRSSHPVHDGQRRSASLRVGARARSSAGTAWLWSREDAFEAVDVLFVDEAAQMSLANVLAVAQAAHERSCCSAIRSSSSSRCRAATPRNGCLGARSHPRRARRPSPMTEGLFLEETWRLHPDICAFTSELFYEGRLRSRPGSSASDRDRRAAVAGTGLRVPARRAPGQPERFARGGRRGRAIWSSEILARGARWIDRDGQRTAAHARRHPDHRAVQRPGVRDSRSACRARASAPSTSSRGRRRRS